MSVALPIINGSILVDLPLSAECPLDIRDWLLSLGWYITGNAEFNCSVGSVNYYQMTWSEAVSVETYRLLTIGGAK